MRWPVEVRCAGSVGVAHGGGLASRPEVAGHYVTFEMGFVTVGWGCGLQRSDGARAWSTVLSELAQVRVSVEWERPTWRVSWQGRPDPREALMGRAAALGRYRVGAPLPFEDLRFARSSSAVAIAVAWLARGSPDSPAAARAAVADVEAFCADTRATRGPVSMPARSRPPSCCAGSATATSRKWVCCW